MIERRFVTPNIFTLADFLTAEECAATQARVEPEFRVQAGMRRRVAYDDPVEAATLWQRLAPFVPPLVEMYPPTLTPEPPAGPLDVWAPIGLNPRMRFYLYGPGEFFPPHRDISYAAPDDSRSFLTLIIYLAGDCAGGHTRLRDYEIDPVAGSALVFPHELLHEGAEVLDGRKCVLRSDIMYSRS